MARTKPKLEEYELEGVDSLFDPSLSAENKNPQTISISSITLPSQQPRRYFDAEALSKLTHSIKEKGILQPLLVRRIDNGSYELVAGKRRFQ